MTSQPLQTQSIDGAYLLRKFPDLSLLLRQGYHPDEVGRAWLNRALRSSSRQQSRLKQHGEAEDWDQAKTVLHRVLHTDDPDYQSIRARLFARPRMETAAILPMLGLWLAGHLGLSLTVVTPLVAVMLYEIATGVPLETTN